MPSRIQRLTEDTGELTAALAAIRTRLELPEGFSDEVESEAAAAVAALRLPEADATAIEFVTIDPEGSTDLDQALHIEQDGDGFVVRYAIADVPAFVEPGGAIDQEARRRGQTLYAPDGRIPLHPIAISEDAGSLLPDAERGAFVWTMRLDATGAVTETALERARVRSRAQLTYRSAQDGIDDGSAPASLQLLKTVGELRIALEVQRGGASLDMPEEEIAGDETSGWRIERRELLPVESWNAQISLMTGLEAARIMVEAKAGILRTMPKPSRRDIATFRKQAEALGLPWPDDEPYGTFLRRLDRSEPATLAVLVAARMLFRGAGYTVLAGSLPDDVEQAAIGAPYAHATAPLRRLVDRYVLVHCEALANGRQVPEWATAGLEGLPEVMQQTSQLAGALERESIDAVEIVLLRPHVGETFDAVVLARRDEGKGATVQIVDPPAEGRCDTQAEAGAAIRVRLDEADLAAGLLRFSEA